MTPHPPRADIEAIRAKLAKVQFGNIKQIRYDHGGGRMYLQKGESRSLIIDAYEEGDREFYFDAAQTVSTLCDEVESLRAEVERLNQKNSEAVWFLVSTIYLADSSDYKSDMLNALLRLDKDAFDLLQKDERAAYEKYVEKARQPK